jgi:hypothetical protein
MEATYVPRVFGFQVHKSARQLVVSNGDCECKRGEWQQRSQMLLSGII